MNSRVLFWILFLLTVGAIVLAIVIPQFTDASMEARGRSADRSEATIEQFLQSQSAERHAQSELEVLRSADGAGSPRALTRTQPFSGPTRQWAGTSQAPSRSATSAAVRNAPSGGLPALDEEVWVIVKPDPETAPADDQATPGSGALICRLPQEGRVVDVPVPLEHTDVSTSISAYIASVLVKQRFKNPYESKIEAVYVFPLPQNAAVNIRGIIRERQEAERIYREARSQGYVASLLTQERPNVFTQKVANIEPGKQIEVEITYFHTLTYDDGWYEYTFPMVVAPRFNPPGTSDGIGAVARGRRGASGQRTEVQYLRPDERSGHDISLGVDIMAGVSIEEIKCNSHKIEFTNLESEQVRVTLSPGDSIPNKDFVLRYRVAGDQVKTALLTHQGEDGGYFTFMLYPPQDRSDLERSPMEMIFVLDCSGSMRGAPMAQSRKAIDHALRQLRPQDTFQVIRFSNNASQLDPMPIPATPSNVRNGRSYVSKLQGSGGTQMIEGIKAALDFDHDPERLRFVTFLTDGHIGNESHILGEIHHRLGPARIFSFGVGSSPNRYLLNRMAKQGRGAVAYLGLNDDGGEVMDHFFERISHPVLTNIAIDWGSMEVEDVIPARLPDLFVGRPVIVTGKFRNPDATTVHVKGRAGKQVVEAPFEVDPVGSAHAGKALPSIWARMRIAELADRATWDPNVELGEQVRALALQYSLMSSFTSFVAVDSLTRTAGAYGTTVAVPVPVADGMRYETTVAE
ncbi:MAG: VIT domain-containing protein [Planctomycetota bacterium]|jgi:Ca-activated chloride channel family protein